MMSIDISLEKKLQKTPYDPTTNITPQRYKHSCHIYSGSPSWLCSKQTLLSDTFTVCIFCVESIVHLLDKHFFLTGWNQWHGTAAPTSPGETWAEGAWLAENTKSQLEINWEALLRNGANEMERIWGKWTTINDRSWRLLIESVGREKWANVWKDKEKADGNHDNLTHDDRRTTWGEQLLTKN